MNSIRMAGVWILISIFVGILFWTVLPSPRVEDTYPIDLSQPILLNHDCSIESKFKNITIHTKRPVFLHYGSKATFEVLVIKEYPTASTHENVCAYSLELSLDLGNYSIGPKDRLIQPLVEGQDQLFVFDIQSGDNKRKQDGYLWIYLNSTSPDTQSSIRSPLLVIPLEITTRSVLGIPLLWLRLILITAIFLLLILKVLNHKLE